MNIAEAARYAGVSRGTVESWLARGLLPYENLPGGGDGKYRFRRIRKVDLDAFLAGCYHGIHYTEKPAQNADMGHQGVFLKPRTP